MTDADQADPEAVIRCARRRRITIGVAAVVLALVGGLLLVTGLARQEPSPPRRADPAAGAPTGLPAGSAAPRSPGRGGADGDSDSGRPVHAPLAASDPVKVSIPSIEVSSPLEHLGLDDQKGMETPRDPAKAGWYHPGPSPGAKGPAVIAGHVTWNGTPSVFFKLATLAAGDTITVRREDGITAEFAVDRVEQYPKDRFPTVDVYRNLDHAGLRLITCGGDYSTADRHYSDNIVVYATLTGARS